MNNLEDIKNRLAAATPGPWDTEEIVPGQFAVYALPLQDNGAHLGVTGYDEWDGDRISAADAEFIAHAPEDIARLVKALESVMEQLLWAEACKTQWTSADALRAKITEALDS